MVHVSPFIAEIVVNSGEPFTLNPPEETWVNPKPKAVSDPCMVTTPLPCVSFELL